MAVIFCEAVVLGLILFFVASTFYNARPAANSDNAEPVALAERTQLRQSLLDKQDSDAKSQYDY